MVIELTLSSLSNADPAHPEPRSRMMSRVVSRASQGAALSPVHSNGLLRLLRATLGKVRAQL